MNTLAVSSTLILSSTLERIGNFRNISVTYSAPGGGAKQVPKKEGNKFTLDFNISLGLN
jgi:hypothetical protein